MIKIPIEKVILQARELPPYVDPVMREAGAVLLDPHEALKALEEQAPEVRNDRLADNYAEGYAKAYQTAMRDNQRLTDLLEDVVNELDLSNLAVERHGPLGTKPAELVKLVLQEKDTIIQCLKAGMVNVGESKSPWIKVSDQPPPKDGKPILVKEFMFGYEYPERMAVFRGSQWVDLLTMCAMGEKPHFKKWMPIPK